MGLKNFPKGYKPTSSQQYAIPNILEGFRDCKFVVVQGPTGCGKSFIAKTVANGLKKLPSRLSTLVTDYRAFEITRINNKLTYEYADYFENQNFSTGTLAIAKKISENTDKKSLVSILGGGDTISAINKVAIAK